MEAELASGLRPRGYIDRLDIAPSGQMRIVDYKTGGAPPEEFEARALFQMRFYALTLWRAQGQVPKLLQLMYLGNGEIVAVRAGRGGPACHRAQDRGAVARDRAGHAEPGRRPRPGRICDWCAHQAICPAFGGTPPPVPDAPVRPDEIPGSRGIRRSSRILLGAFGTFASVPAHVLSRPMRRRGRASIAWRWKIWSNWASSTASACRSV